MIEFKPWPKTPRLFRDIVVTEKIDGTNAAIIIDEEGNVGAQSRNRLITPEADNFGFAGWVSRNATALLEHLGPGYHYGEWWGNGIQRGYDQSEKHFSLFNTHRFKNIKDESLGLLDVVPVIYQGPNLEAQVRQAIKHLVIGGSLAAPGYMNPEGVCVYHSASGQVYKSLIESDHLPKALYA